jgi:CTP:molybdopterin cytidylyltransferase MocA
VKPLGVVLAAGASRRMGRPKALLELDGRTLVQAHVDAFRPVCDAIVVVTSDQITVDVVGAEVLVNRAPDAQMIDSLRLALIDRAVNHAIVTPVDVPPAAAGTLTALLAVPAPAVPVDDGGRPGHPVLIGRQEIAAILAAPPGGGLRALLRQAARIAVADPDVALDFDDPPSWATFLARRGGG